jgi:hypothetical protein
VRYEAQAETIERTTLLQAIRAFNDAVTNYRGGWQPQLALELALMEALKPVVEDVGIRQVSSLQTQPLPAAQQPPVEATPGAPPVVEMAAVRDKWGQMLFLLGKRSSNAPEVMRYFKVLRVDGNVIHLGTETYLYYEKLQVPEKVQLIEQVLTHIHKTPLRLKIILLNSGDSAEDAVPAESVDMNDPLVSLGAELGAEIKPRETHHSNE